MDYETTIYFAETWGLILLFSLFLIGVVYALWPANGKKFEHAAGLPLEDNDEETTDGGHHG